MPRPRGTSCEPEIGLANTHDWRGTTSHPERDTSFSFGQEGFRDVHRSLAAVRIPVVPSQRRAKPYDKRKAAAIVEAGSST